MLASQKSFRPSEKRTQGELVNYVTVTDGEASTILFPRSRRKPQAAQPAVREEAWPRIRKVFAANRIRVST